MLCINSLANLIYVLTHKDEIIDFILTTTKAITNTLKNANKI